MIKTFVVANGKIDSQGDMLMLDGIKIPDKVLVAKDFDHKQPVSFATVDNTGTQLIATADIPDEMIGLYPAIGFEVVKTHREGDIRFIDECKLHYIGLCFNQNVDDDIKPIL